jgi:hypothetical protein
MSMQTWRQTLTNINTAGTLYNTYTTAKSVLTSATSTGAANGFITLPANFFNVGTELHISGMAGISNRVTGPDTFTVQVMVGAVIAFTTGAINLTTTSNVLSPVDFDIWLTCQTIGNGTLAKLMGHSRWMGQPVAMAASLANNAGGTGFAIAPLTAPAVGTGFDSTVSNTLDLFVAQSFSGAGNGFQINQYRVESLFI